VYIQTVTVFESYLRSIEWDVERSVTEVWSWAAVRNHP